MSDAQQLLDALWGREEGEADVAELVEECIERAHAVIAENAVQRRAVPFAVRAVTADLLSVVRCYFLECDPGEPQLDEATNWTADTEPQPATIDTWSRGAVPLKRRTIVPPVPVGASNPASSAGQSRTPRSPRAASRPKSREAEAKGDVVVAKAPTSGAPPKKGGGSMLTPEEARAARLAAEAREEMERLERLRAEVKGREYTYDAAGNVIVIEQVNPERLPPYQYATRASMAAEPVPVPGKKTRRGSTAKGSGGGGPRFSKVGDYRELDSLQPPLTDTMSMKEGVTMRQGESLVSGPPRAVNPARMSRKDFEAFVATAGRDQAATSPTNPLGGNAAPQTPQAQAPPTPLPPAPLDAAGGAGAGAGGLDASILGADTANDVNLQLMSKDWGMNPPLREVYPARPPRFEANPLKTLGQGRASLPRERSGTGVSARLPPPMLPATAGHGLAPPYDGGAGGSRPPLGGAGAEPADAPAPARTSPLRTSKMTRSALADTIFN